jgi:hypothetical protein
MARVLSSAVCAELANKSTTFVTLVELLFPDGLSGSSAYQRFTTHYRDITYDSNTYSSNASLMGVSQIEETERINTGSVSVMISGISTTNISTALSLDYINAEANIYRAFIGDDGFVIGGSGADSDDGVFNIWHGRISSYTIAEQPSSGTSTITWNLASHWVDFGRVGGRRMNSKSEQFVTGHKTDTGFDAATMPIKNFYWCKLGIRAEELKKRKKESIESQTPGVVTDVQYGLPSGNFG